MAIYNQQTKQSSHEGAVYSVRGTFKWDNHYDIVEVINDDGSIEIIELGQDRIYAQTDATPERIALMKAKRVKDLALWKRARLRECVELASTTALSARQTIELSEALKSAPHLQNYHGSTVDQKMNRYRDVADILARHRTGQIKSNFQVSLINQCVSWATTPANERKFSAPLSAKQVEYFARSH